MEVPSTISSIKNSLNRSIWTKILLFNFVLLAFFACLMRYKLAYSTDLFNYKFIMHAHSHFAFCGWVTQSILFIYLLILEKKTQLPVSKKLKLVLFFNLLCSYGMLVSFSIQGYALYSIIFSFLSIVSAFVFSFFFFKELQRVPINHSLFLKAALIFNMISALGTFCLAYIMASKTNNPELQSTSIYFYLHFQYNGWFIFSCLGIFMNFFANFSISKTFTRVSYVLVITTILSYSLSLLSLYDSEFLRILSILTGITQLVAFIYFIKMIHAYLKTKLNQLNLLSRTLLSIVLFALLLKLILQVLSTFSYFQTFAYENRSIIIAYLHLVFMLIVSVFILFSFVVEKMIRLNRLATVSLLLLVIGFFLNELFLVYEGVSLQNGIIPLKMKESLFFISIFILICGIGLLCSQFLKQKKQQTL